MAEGQIGEAARGVRKPGEVGAQRKTQASAQPSYPTSGLGAGKGVRQGGRVHRAALPREVHPPPPTSDLITRCQPEVEVASAQATTQRSFLPTKMQEPQATPALLYRGGAVGSRFSFPIWLRSPVKGRGAAPFGKGLWPLGGPARPDCAAPGPRPRRVGRRAPGSAQLPAAITALAGTRGALPPGPTLLGDHARCPRCLLPAGDVAPAPGPRVPAPLPVWRPPRVGSAAAQLVPRPSHPSAPRRRPTPGVTSPRRRPPLQRAELGSSR